MPGFPRPAVESRQSDYVLDPDISVGVAGAVLGYPGGIIGTHRRSATTVAFRRTRYSRRSHPLSVHRPVVPEGIEVSHQGSSEQADDGCCSGTHARGTRSRSHGRSCAGCRSIAAPRECLRESESVCPSPRLGRGETVTHNYVLQQTSLDRLIIRPVPQRNSCETGAAYPQAPGRGVHGSGRSRLNACQAATPSMMGNCGRRKTSATR